MSTYLTDEQCEEVRRVCDEVIDMAVRKSVAARSSMPILTIDALMLAGLALRLIDTQAGADERAIAERAWDEGHDAKPCAPGEYRNPYAEREATS